MKLLLERAWFRFGRVGLGCRLVWVDEVYDAVVIFGVAAVGGRVPLDEIVAELLRFKYFSPDEDGPRVFAGGFASDALEFALAAAAVGPDKLIILPENKPAMAAAINIGEAIPLSASHERRMGVALAALCQHALAVCTADLDADIARLVLAEGSTPRVPGTGPPPGPLGDEGRVLEALRSRICRARGLAACVRMCTGWIERPTVFASLRRPWEVSTRTSG